MRDDDLLRTLTMLRFQAHLSHAEHESSSRAFNVTRSFLARGYEEIKEHHRGRLYTYIPDGRIKGYVMHWHQDESWYGPPIQNCALDFDWTDPQAILWATQKLLELQSELGEHCELMLSSRYSSILGVALGAGFQIDSVVLLGRPQESLDRLIHRYAPPDNLGMMNLIIQPLTNRKEVEKIIQLKRTYFTQYPEFCWFGAHDRHLGRHKDELIKAIRQRRQGLTGPIHAWVLHREGEFMGSFSYSEERENALWGHVAGLDIILHPRIQRKGVVKSAYKIMLESMITQGVTLYKGGTSQPAVMGLGKIMNRPLFSWVLRKNAAFTPSQFKYYLPAKLTELEPSP